MHKPKYGLPEEVKFCSRCVMSNQRPASVPEFRHTADSKKPTLSFDENGICDACNNATAKENINWQEREEQLLELLDKYRSKDGSYDCLVPGSGGVLPAARAAPWGALLVLAGCTGCKDDKCGLTVYAELGYPAGFDATCPLEANKCTGLTLYCEEDFSRSCVYTWQTSDWACVGDCFSPPTSSPTMVPTESP